MDFKQLETFLTVAKCKSFSKASKFLYLTQPTLTNHIQNLEKELGLALFHRKSRSITLTDAGELFFPYAQHTLMQKDALLFDLNKLSGKGYGTIDLPASTIPEEFIAPLLIEEFKQRHPLVGFNLRHLDSREVSQAIHDGLFEFGLLGAKYADALHYIPVLEDEMILIGPAQRPLGQSALTMQALLQLPLILREEGSGSGRFFVNKMKESNLSPKDIQAVVTCENTQAIKQLVMKGLGFSIVSKLAVTHEMDQGKIKGYGIADLDMKRTFYFACTKKESASPVNAAFKNYVLEKYGENIRNPVSSSALQV